MSLSFLPRVSVPVGDQPGGLKTGDFNGDGQVDVVVANRGDGTLSVLIGNGDGTFEPQKVSAVGSEPGALAAADFNGDGRLDVAVTSYADDAVTILPGRGDGTFGAGRSVAVEPFPVAIAPGDFNGDGAVDLATASNNVDRTSAVLIGNGDGTFQHGLGYGSDRGTGALTVADVDGDGKADLVTTSYPDEVIIFKGQGDGTFDNGSFYSAGTLVASNTVADVNGDGRADVIVTSGTYGDTVGVLLNEGRGQFGSPTFFATGEVPISVAAGDIDGDGHVDLVTTNAGDGSVSVLLGDGQGDFAAPVDFDVGASPTSASLADVNQDGRLDILTANAAADTISVRLNVSTPAEPAGDTLVFRVSEDAYKGDAQFAVFVDGKQVGGVQTVTASHALGQHQDITVSGDLASDPTRVAVVFLNDSYDGRPDQDRNLYVDKLTYNGRTFEAEAARNNVGRVVGDSAALFSDGSLTFDLRAPSQPDTFVFRVSEDAFRGDAQFAVFVDGKQVGGDHTVTASHANGLYQDVVVSGDFDPDPKRVAVVFLNDSYNGSPDQDRNLYVDKLTYNGHVFEAEDAHNNVGHIVGDSAALFSNGSLTFDVTGFLV